MPCTYYLPGEEAGIRASEYKAELDETTRLLCSLTKKTPPEVLSRVRGLRAWVKKHEEMDCLRRKRE
jgi:hypothetical protein